MEFWDQIDSQPLQQFRSLCIWIDGSRNEPNKSQLIIQQLSVVSSQKKSLSGSLFSSSNLQVLLGAFRREQLPVSKYNFLISVTEQLIGGEIMVDQFQI